MGATRKRLFGRSSQVPDVSGDQDLWMRVCEGDQRAFGVLFDRYADLIYNVAFRRTGRWDVAEDIVATVFLEAWRQRHQIHIPDGSIRSWLIGVAVNGTRRYWRSAERGRRALLRLAASENHERDPAGKVSERLDAERRMAEILIALNDLPSQQREVIQLWAWEELSYEEIAVVLGIPVGTVRSRLYRARARLGRANGTGRLDRASGDDTPSGAASNRERARKEGGHEA